MIGVIKKFFLTSMLMWAVPLLILYGFNHQLFPGVSELSSSSITLISGFLAVIAVNLVIGVYIFMALKEPTQGDHKPDEGFLAHAKASVKQTSSSAVSQPEGRNKED